MLLGHQDLDALTDQFVCLIAKQDLHLRIDENDPPLVIRDDHRVRCTLEQAANLLGVVAEQVLEALSMRARVRPRGAFSGVASALTVKDPLVCLIRSSGHV